MKASGPIALAALLAWLCGTAAQGQVRAAPERAPQALFAAKCVQCHDAAGWGTRNLRERVGPKQAELLVRDALPAAYVKRVVRYGIGSMPQFTPTDLSDAELERLAGWLAQGPGRDRTGEEARP